MSPVPHVVVVDNYDSFTFNLVQYLAMRGARVSVFLHDAIDIAGVRALRPDGVLLSPGPPTGGSLHRTYWRPRPGWPW